MSIATIRQALSNAVDGLAGVRALPYMPDQVNPPQAVVLLRSIDYHLDLDSGSTYHFAVVMFAGRTSERTAEALLDTYREPTGATSVATVIEADSGVAAVCNWVSVISVGAIQVMTVGEIDYLTVAVEMEMVL